jgi:DNA-binding CsgD family transcriptional regulator
MPPHKSGFFHFEGKKPTFVGWLSLSSVLRKRGPMTVYSGEKLTFTKKITKMNIIDEFFLSKNDSENISEDDYKRITPPLIAAFEAISRHIFQSIYIIDFYRKNFLYVSGNPFSLCGLPPAEVKDMGLTFYVNYVPENVLNMQLEFHRARHAFLSRTPLEDRLKLTFSSDFHIQNGNTTVLINHKLTPIALFDSGNVWLACCSVSLSSWPDAGHLEVHMAGKKEYWTYSLQSHEWEQKSLAVLKDREKDILLLSARGLTEGRIAEKLHLGTHTVKSYKKKLYEKLHVNNISEAIQVAVNYKMI